MNPEPANPASVDLSASDTVAAVEAAIDKLLPKVERTDGGPRPTPVPQSPAKRRRLIARASRKASRPRKATRRQRRRHVAPRMA